MMEIRNKKIFKSNINIKVKLGFRITFPVVNDGLPARIRACETRPGLANCGGVRRGSERSDRPSRTEPEPPKAAKRLQSCYTPQRRTSTPLFI